MYFCICVSCVCVCVCMFAYVCMQLHIINSQNSVVQNLHNFCNFDEIGVYMCACVCVCVHMYAGGQQQATNLERDCINSKSSSAIGSVNAS